MLVTRINVHPYQRLTVSLTNPQGVMVFDGPGMLSDQLNHNSSVISLSSFQSFIVLYKSPRHGRYTTENIKNQGLSYYGSNTSVTRIYVTSLNTVEVPQCTSYLSHQDPNYDRNCHTVCSFTSETGFVNLSITKLFYIGYDQGCVEGGIAYTSSSGYFDKLCQNYTMNVQPKNVENTPVVNIVNERENSFFLVVYSYKHYGQVFLEAAVSSTICKGVFVENKSKFSWILLFC